MLLCGNCGNIFAAEDAMRENKWVVLCPGCGWDCPCEQEEILNLTQHIASEEQVVEGVVEPTNKGEIQNLLTFEEFPYSSTFELHALKLTNVAVRGGYKKVLIGGAPFFMSTLERYLWLEGVTPLYAFSLRESVEEFGVKKSKFRHLGFVEARRMKFGDVLRSFYNAEVLESKIIQEADDGVPEVVLYTKDGRRVAAWGGTGSWVERPDNGVIIPCE